MQVVVQLRSDGLYSIGLHMQGVEHVPPWNSGPSRVQIWENGSNTYIFGLSPSTAKVFMGFSMSPDPIAQMEQKYVPDPSTNLKSNLLHLLIMSPPP